LQTAYRIFDAVLTDRRVLSPHMSRLTFGGEQIAAMRTLAPDQRIKLFFPKTDGTPSAIPNRPDWYDIYRTLPPAERAPMRTYTIRRLSGDRLDVDFVLHGDNGPASRWAMRARLGDAIQISAPNAHCDAKIGGYEWEPPVGVKQVLLIADETALPAAAGILEQLAAWPKPPRAQVFIEVAAEADRLALPSWPGLSLEWLLRGSKPYGAEMIAAAARADIPSSAFFGHHGDVLAEVDPDRDILWDRADPGGIDADPVGIDADLVGIDADQARAGFYGWVAGETAAVSRIRAMLINERGLDRRLMSLMGYWRYGKPHA